jgi:UDP-N-acetylglucosamine 1-carboxyvinyltransferase
VDRFVIRGGVPLRGEVEVSGSKNAVLALMAAALLSEDEVVFTGVPELRDVDTMARILEQLGVTVQRHGGELRLCAGSARGTEAPYDLVRTMRASFMVLGPLLARRGQARVSLPGGCAIGARPVDQHLKGLEALGAKIRLAGGYVEARAERLTGGRIVFDVSTVNGTQNVLMAACLAEGSSVIENAALEPEVGELIRVLQGMGAHIEGAGTERLEVEGVRELSGVTHRVPGDRIEAASLLIAIAISGGEGVVVGANPDDLHAVIQKLRETGLELETDGNRISLRCDGPIGATRVKTAPFPGFPTDVQAQMMALLCLAEGPSLITETIFENRFMHVSELRRLGADIHIEGRTAVLQGVPELSGAPVMATDLRASASLVLAGLAARGETTINRVYHIDRGYDRIEQKLQSLGARIRREKV